MLLYFRSICDDLIEIQSVASLCLFAGTVKSTNVLQIVLQSAHLNWREVPAKIKSLIRSLESKGEHIENSTGCYFSHLD